LNRDAIGVSDDAGDRLFSSGDSPDLARQDEVDHTSKEI
jgi:hypothetical protein